ncbi:MAG: hypothetical protein ACP5PZ_11245 [Bacteroidales bacterium]
MKKIIIVLLAIISVGVSAQQTTIDVQRNSTHKFSVSVSNGVLVNANGYTWSADTALGANFTSTNTDTTSVTFTGAVNNTGNISVYATSASNSCSGNSQTRKFRIVKQLAVSAKLDSLSDICPKTTSNPSGGDIPSFSINFVDVSNNPVNVSGFSYQIVDPFNNVGTPVNVSVSNLSTYNLDINTAYDNTQTGTYTIRIVSITPFVGNMVYYPDASGNYPQTTFNVNLAPELTW